MPNDYAGAHIEQWVRVANLGVVCRSVVVMFYSRRDVCGFCPLDLQFVLRDVIQMHYCGHDGSVNTVVTRHAVSPRSRHCIDLPY